MGTKYVIRILDNVISQLFSRVNFESTPPLIQYYYFRIKNFPILCLEKTMVRISQFKSLLRAFKCLRPEFQCPYVTSFSTVYTGYTETL